MEWVHANIPSLVIAAVVGLVFLIFGGWPIWILISMILSSIRWVWALYTFVRLALDVVGFFLLQLVHRCHHLWAFLTCPRHIRSLRASLHRACSYQEWLQIAQEIDQVCNKTEWQLNPTLPPADFDYETLAAMSKRLEEKRAAGQMGELMFLLQGIIKRNSLGVDHDPLHNECLSGTKECITQFINQVEACLIDVCCSDALSVEDKVAFFNKCKLNLGRSALSLSGGGSLGMYHTGVLLALIEADCVPNVITGASGGSIVAAMVACKTTQELKEEICVSDISVRYLPEGVRWFPPIWQQAVNFWSHGVLIQGSDFDKCTERYYGDITFQEAYERTGKHVTITVSASSANATGTFKLLLNHITEPRVTLASAVRASCSLPGIMEPASLKLKGPNGEIVPYFLSKERKFVDGSVTSDIPRNRIVSTFNVTNFIVSQVNPHIVPFLAKSADPRKKGALKRLEEVANLDIRYRCQILAKLQVIPNLFGQDMTKIFNQSYVGNVTIVPRLTTADIFNAVMNPSVSDMEKYLREGKRATYPKLPKILHLTHLERRVSRCLHVLHLHRQGAEAPTVRELSAKPQAGLADPDPNPKPKPKSERNSSRARGVSNLSPPRPVHPHSPLGTHNAWPGSRDPSAHGSQHSGRRGGLGNGHGAGQAVEDADHSIEGVAPSPPTSSSPSPASRREEESPKKGTLPAGSCGCAGCEEEKAQLKARLKELERTLSHLCGRLPPIAPAHLPSAS